MRIEKLPYEKVEALSSKDLAYIGLANYLKPYYTYRPELSEFAEAILERQKHPVDRAMLVTVLKEQYEGEDLSQATHDNIEALAKPKTFTIITAHQPALFTGPLYYIFKIASCINLCKQLNHKYSDYKFVPLFINGSEDHDFDEIDHCHIKGTTVQWKRNASGSCGDLDLVDLDKAIDEAEKLLPPSNFADSLIKSMRKALKNATVYDDFVLTMVNDIFGKYGLVIANGGDKRLKANFADIIRKEIFEQPSQKLIEKTQNELNAIGHKPQAHARAINLFYKYDGERIRIEQEGDIYRLVDTHIEWTKEEMEAQITNYPERFSPNVAMRPIFQEFTFPNLAYIGGGGEIAYWLERKRQFEYLNVFYPMLIRRNSAMIINENINRTIGVVGMGIEKYFSKTHNVITDFLGHKSDMVFDLSAQKEELDTFWKKIAEKAKAIDPTLEMTMLAKGAEQKKAITFAEKKMKKHLKARENVSVNRIEKIRHTLFPNEGLQERYDNFLPFYAEDGDNLISYLIEHLDPMDKRFSIIYT